MVIDARMYQHGGIGTYIENLLRHLSLDVAPLKAPIYSVAEQLEYARKIPPCDFFFSPHFNVPLFKTRAQRQIVTIHDTFHLDNPIPLAKKFAAKVYLKKAVKADSIITVSEFSKSRILHHFPEAQGKITVIHPGADHLLHIKPKSLKLPKPFYLFVGSKKPHKNLGVLKNVPNLIALTDGNLPLENLVWLYQNAEALIFPSLYEGWGLPPLEAMSLGCPVIASKTASIPEASKDAALYIETDLETALKKLPKQRESLIEKGKARSAQFTWKGAAERHLHLFRNFSNQRHPKFT